MVQLNPDFGEQLIDTAIPLGGEPTPRTFWMDVLDNIPSLPASMANLGRRGSNTILYGGRNPGAPARTWMGQAFRDNLNPRSFMRFSDQSIFFNQPAFFGGNVKGGAGYSPFHLSQIGNSIARSMAGQSEGVVGKRVGSMFSNTRVGKMAASSFDDGGAPFAQGMLSRISAASRIANMKDAQYARLTARPGRGIGTFLQGSGMNLTPAQLADRRTASLATYSSAGRVGGFMGAARHGMSTGVIPSIPTPAGGLPPPPATFRPSAAYGRDLIAVQGNAAGRAGAATAARWAADIGLQQGYTAKQLLSATMAQRSVPLAAKGGGLLAARGIAVAAPGLQVVGTALLVKDIAKMAATGIPHLASGAVRSYVGDVSRGPFDRGYQDTDAALTSRQRGVAAISASRLNARSILGNESAALFQHFG